MNWLRRRRLSDDVLVVLAMRDDTGAWRELERRHPGVGVRFDERMDSDDELATAGEVLLAALRS